MPLLVPSKTIMGEWGFTEGSHLTTRPADSTYGTSITPGNNTYGTAVQVGSDTTVDAWAILINVNSIATSTASKDSLTQIGFDFSGAGTFPGTPTRYNSIELLTSCAGTMALAAAGGGGVWYYFPLFIPAGTAIMARGTVNNATVGTQRVWWQTFGRPKYPEATRRGTYVESLGIVAASSKGTTITPGTTSDGTAVSLGSLNADHPAWYWEFGYGIADTTMTAAVIFCDLLRNSNTGPIILQNGYVIVSGNEAISKHASLNTNPIADCPGSTEIFARSQSSTTADTVNSMAAYGVGG